MISGCMQRCISVAAILGLGLLSSGTAISAVAHAFSTGIAADHTQIAIGAEDDDWQLVSAPTGVALGAVTVVNPARGFFANFGPAAQWVSPDTATNSDAPWGLYTYATSFDVDLGLWTGLWLTGEYAADNRLIDIRVNGSVVFVGPSLSGNPCPAEGCSEFLSPISFSLPDMSWLIDGANSLTVTVENQGPSTSNPTAFVFSASLNGEQRAVPEAPSLQLALAGLCAIVFVHRRRTSVHRRRRGPPPCLPTAVGIER